MTIPLGRVAAAWPTSAFLIKDADLTRPALAAAASLRDSIAFLPHAESVIGTLRKETAGRFLRGLAVLARADVALARVVEPHLDALGILAQAGMQPTPRSTWGVFASHSPGTNLVANSSRGHWTVSGTKQWCSLAGQLTDALATADGPEGRALFAVSLTQPGVRVDESGWASRALPSIASGPVVFTEAAAEPVGAAGWYLRRPGFAWGGIGVAACWWGGGEGVLDAVRRHAEAHPDSASAWTVLGLCEADLAACEFAVAAAATAIEAGQADGDAAARLSATVRAIVRDRVDAVRHRAVRELGPAALAMDGLFAARVSDLELYVLQDHGDADRAGLARLMVEQESR